MIFEALQSAHLTDEPKYPFSVLSRSESRLVLVFPHDKEVDWHHIEILFRSAPDMPWKSKVCRLTTDELATLAALALTGQFDKRVSPSCCRCQTTVDPSLRHSVHPSLGFAHNICQLTVEPLESGWSTANWGKQDSSPTLSTLEALSS